MLTRRESEVNGDVSQGSPITRYLIVISVQFGLARQQVLDGTP